MECMVCLSAYDSQDYRPLFLPCGHSVCANCVSDLSENRASFLCPSCRKEISSSEVGNLPVNYSLLTQPHQQSPALPEESKEGQAIREMCSFHQTKKVKFNCSGCKQVFCSKCVIKHTGAGHNIEELSFAVDRKIDQTLLIAVNLHSDLLAITKEFTAFEGEVNELNALKTSLEQQYADCLSALQKERDESLSEVTRAIERNQLAKAAARKTLDEEMKQATELLDLLRNSRHSISDLFQKKANLERVEGELAKLQLVRPECEVTEYRIAASHVPEKFIELKEEKRIFSTPEEVLRGVAEEEHKEVPSPVEGKKEVVVQKGVEIPVKPAGSIVRAPQKAIKRGEVCWWYMSDTNSWAPYAPALSRTLEQAYQNSDKSVDLGRYIVDFSTLLQTNKATKKKRKVGREIS